MDTSIHGHMMHMNCHSAPLVQGETTNTAPKTFSPISLVITHRFIASISSDLSTGRSHASIVGASALLALIPRSSSAASSVLLAPRAPLPLRRLCPDYSRARRLDARSLRTTAPTMRLRRNPAAPLSCLPSDHNISAI